MHTQTQKYKCIFCAFNLVVKTFELMIRWLAVRFHERRVTCFFENGLLQSFSLKRHLDSMIHVFLLLIETTSIFDSMKCPEDKAFSVMLKTTKILKSCVYKTLHAQNVLHPANHSYIYNRTK